MRDEVYIRVVQRPMLPPILAASLLIGVIAGAGIAFKFMVDNGPIILSFVVTPLVVWWAYARHQYQRGAYVRALIATAAFSCIAYCGFIGLEWHRNAASATWSEAEFAAPCRAHLADMKAGTGPRRYQFDTCHSFLTRQQAVDLCKPRLMQGGRLPEEWNECTRYVSDVLPFR